MSRDSTDNYAESNRPINPFLLFHPDIVARETFVTVENLGLSEVELELRRAVNLELYGCPDDVTYAIQLASPAVLQGTLVDTLERFSVYGHLDKTKCWPVNRNALLSFVPSFFDVPAQGTVADAMLPNTSRTLPLMGTISFDQLNLGYSTQWEYKFGWPPVVSETVTARGSLETIHNFDFGNGQHYPHESHFNPFEKNSWKLKLNWDSFRWFKQAHVDDPNGILTAVTYQLARPSPAGPPETRWYRTEVFRSYRDRGTPYEIPCPGLFAEAAPGLVRVINSDRAGGVTTSRWHPELFVPQGHLSSGIPLAIDGPVLSISRYFIGKHRRTNESCVIDDLIRFSFARTDGSLIGVALQRIDHESIYQDWRSTPLASHIAKSVV